MAGNVGVGRGGGAVWGTGSVGVGTATGGARGAANVGVMGFVGHGLPCCGSAVGCRVSGLRCIPPGTSLAVLVFCINI